MPPMQVPSPDDMLDRLRSLPAAAPLLARLGERSGVYLVGGAVRDLLMGGAPIDLDLVVEGDDTVAAVPALLGGHVRAHDRFGTTTVTANGFSYDVARARRETYAYPGALPDVRPAPLAEDLLRRDFTVNALAVGLAGPGAGELRAAPGALEDLDAGVLRVLHDRSFVDDPTRLLRLVRYAARLGFTPEPRTAELARDAVSGHALRTVSGARVGTELRLLACERDPVAAFSALREQQLDREIEPDFGLHDAGLARAALGPAPADVRRDRLLLALASRRLRPARLRALLDSLAFEASDRDAIVATASGADALADALRAARAPSEIADAARREPAEAVALAGALGAAAQARDWLERLRHVHLAIDGNDLIQAGVPEGPAIGAGLRAALAATLDGRAETRDQQLDEALRAAA
jgi:tRNA nucleotidyltransferase (CCA-adding enzyme)